MASSTRGKTAGRLDRVRKATGSAAKSVRLPGLVSVGQSQQINALQGRSNLTDSKIHALEDSLQKQQQALNGMVNLATRRQEDIVSRMKSFESQAGQVEERQKALAQTLDDSFAAMSRDFEHLRSTIVNDRCIWDAERVKYQIDLEGVKQELDTNRMNMQQLEVRCQGMRDTLQAIEAERRLYGKLRITKLFGILQTDQPLTEATFPLTVTPTPGEATTNAPDHFKHPSKAIRRFLRQFDRYQDAYGKRKPHSEEDFLWGFLGLLHPLIAEFLQETLIKRCPQYVTLRKEPCKPHPKSGVVPIIVLQGITGKPLTGDIFFRALDSMDMRFVSMELLEKENSET
ncbi:uncharacterized protein PG986_007668 [Apiospora aurea]|uniref:Uncharacterized protein n=1 Tax=Apiospora aurea TaxID=335848 RepID=A0ABR1QD88_9PEZI